MKALIFSDSHGDSYSIKKAISLHPDCEIVFFLGDGLSDIEKIKDAYPDKAFLAVKGNCDSFGYIGNSECKKTDHISLEGKKIVFTHGDLYGVKWGIDGLKLLAGRSGADIILFGHTHIPFEKYISEEELSHQNRDAEGCLEISSVYLFNPGSIGGDAHSYGILHVDQKNVLFSFGNV